VGVALRIGIVIGALIALIGLIVAIFSKFWVGLIVILVGLAIAVVFGGLMQAHDLYRSLRGWHELMKDGGPDELHLVSAEPPKGFLFRRDATLKFEARRGTAATQPLERTIPVPIPQAFLWRVLGRIPLPIGRLTDERKLNIAIKRAKPKGAAPPPAPPQPPQ
jgi:hypothetical protein